MCATLATVLVVLALYLSPAQAQSIDATSERGVLHVDSLSGNLIMDTARNAHVLMGGVNITALAQDASSLRTQTPSLLAAVARRNQSLEQVQSTIDFQSSLIASQNAQIQAQQTVIDSLAQSYSCFLHPGPVTINTMGATSWDVMTFRGITRLVVTNYYDGSTFNVASNLYTWNESYGRPVLNQTIIGEGSTFVKFFLMNNVPYFVIANYGVGSTTPVPSIVYRPSARAYVRYATIPTTGAWSVTPFTIDSKTYLAFANRDSNTVDVYVHDDLSSQFVHTQTLAFDAPYAVEAFTMGDTTFLAIANHYSNLGYDTDSFIMRWSRVTSSFILFQNISTNQCPHLKPFTISNASYIAVANFGAQSGHIYRYSSMQTKFVYFQSLSVPSPRSAEAFTIGANSFLIFPSWVQDRVHSIDSTLWQWDPLQSLFVAFQRIPTTGGSWAKFFTTPFPHLAIANQLNETTYLVQLQIFKWCGSKFVTA